METHPLAEVPALARIRVHDFGSVDEVSEFSHAVDDVVTVWTRCVDDDDPFAVAALRGLVTADSEDEMLWLPSDALVEIVEPPHYAGQPEDVIKSAVPVTRPAGSRGPMKTSEGWPPLIWNNDLVHSPAQGWTDAEIAVEVLLCAIAVAPTGDPTLRPTLVAALRARYAKLTRDHTTYPPNRYPWRGRTHPGPNFLRYLTG